MAHKQITPPEDRFLPDAWAGLGLDADLVEAVRHAKFGPPTDIQQALIPHALAGQDCLGQAKTGTGKTAAFSLPIIQRLTPGTPGQALILVPTRELAAQVDQHFRLLSRQHPLRTAVLYGGRSLREQVHKLSRQPEVVIGTPGRILDLIGRKELHLSHVRFVVLDEVDRMLDIGFRDDIRKILKSIKTPHQTLFVSATIDDDIHRLAKSFMRDPVELNISRDTAPTVDTIDQSFVAVHPRDKFETLLGLLREEQPRLAIVFTNTKAAARRVAQRLQDAGVNCQEIHGDLVQAKRERVMKSFRGARIQVLVATDLASRGLDVMDISHIINYDAPQDPTGYVHRIGRTARMGQHGRGIMFVTPEQGGLLTEIEKLINKEIPRLDAPWVARRHGAVAPRSEPVRRPEQWPLSEQAPPAAQDEAAPPAAVAARFRERRRSEVLEAYGVRPVRRTLGSRFPSSRRRR